jgi:hypothetical protein
VSACPPVSSICGVVTRGTRATLLRSQKISPGTSTISSKVIVRPSKLGCLWTAQEIRIPALDVLHSSVFETERDNANWGQA